MILSGLGASHDSAPVGRRKHGPPSVVFQPYLSSSSSFIIVIIIIIIIIIIILAYMQLARHPVWATG